SGSAAGLFMPPRFLSSPLMRALVSHFRPSLGRRRQLADGEAFGAIEGPEIAAKPEDDDMSKIAQELDILLRTAGFIAGLVEVAGIEKLDPQLVVAIEILSVEAQPQFPIEALKLLAPRRGWRT